MARGGNRKRDKRKGRRSLENPNTPLNVAYPDDDTLEAFGATRSQSGVRVGRKRALGYPAIWRAVSLITGDVAKLPLLTYKVDGENRTVDRSHYSYRLLRYKANEFLLAFHLKQILTGHALCQGNGYAYIDRAGSRPSELLILDPDRVEVVRVAGEVWYVYGDGKEANEQDSRRPTSLHIKGLGYDGLVGYPVSGSSPSRSGRRSRPATSRRGTSRTTPGRAGPCRIRASSSRGAAESPRFVGAAAQGV
jgi:phage portal protein BeeE